MRSLGLRIFILGTLALLLVTLFASPISLRTILSAPLESLWGSEQQLTATLLDVSQADSFQAAGHRLLRPFGEVRLTRVLDETSSRR